MTRVVLLLALVLAGCGVPDDLRAQEGPIRWGTPRRADSTWGGGWIVWGTDRDGGLWYALRDSTGALRWGEECYGDVQGPVPAAARATLGRVR